MFHFVAFGQSRHQRDVNGWLVQAFGRRYHLHQNAFDPTDTYTSLPKQVLMMRAILSFYDKALEALRNGANIELLVNMPVRERIGRYKYEPEDKVAAEFDSIQAQLDSEIADVLKRSDD